MAGRLIEIKSFLTGVVAIFADLRFSIGKLYVEFVFQSSNERALVFSAASAAAPFELPPPSPAPAGVFF